jgi:TPR repeat protein
MYEYGKDVPRDDKTALKWCRLAAEHGHSHYRCREDGTIETI